MSGLAWALDAAVVVLLLGLATRIVFTRDLFEATVLFIAFGLTLSLAWVRLEAPDLALAEAALGAGVTGALLLYAHRRLSELTVEPAPSDVVLGPETGRTGRDRLGPLRWVLGGTVGALAVGFGALIPGLPEREPFLPARVAERLAETAASNPVTGVVLDFRAYDTLLEVGVLVVAMVAVWSMDRGTADFARPGEERPGEDLILGALTRLVVPVVGLTAVYLVWIGGREPGGAFQAGALLAGTGVLLAAAGILRPVTAAAPLVRALGVAGFGVVIVVGLGTLIRSGSFLAYPEGRAHGLLLLIEGVLAVSIAVVLTALFIDVTAVPAGEPSPERVDPTGDPLGRASGPEGGRSGETGDDG